MTLSYFENVDRGKEKVRKCELKKCNVRFRLILIFFYPQNVGFLVGEKISEPWGRIGSGRVGSGRDGLYHGHAKVGSGRVGSSLLLVAVL